MGVKISVLTASAGAALTDIYPIVQGGVTKRQTLQQTKDLLDGYYFLNGGNSFGAAARIGTNDAFALEFETNGTKWGGFLSNGGFELFGGNGFDATASIRQRSFSNQEIVDIYNNSQGNYFFRARDNNAGTRQVLMADGLFQMDMVSSHVGFGQSPSGTIKYTFRSDSAADNWQYIPFAGNGAIYMSEDGSGNPRLYMQDSGSTTVIDLNTSGTSKLAGGDIEIGDSCDFIFNTGTGTKLGTGTNQKISIWNASPMVQPTTAFAAATFVANTSGIADDTATFDGYTLGQVVKALRTFGFLA